MPIITSQDLFYLVLTIATVILTALFAWLLFYLISIIRQTNEVVKSVTNGIEKVHGILETLQESVHASSSHLSLIVSTIQRLVTFYQRRHAKDAPSGAGAPARRKGR